MPPTGVPEAVSVPEVPVQISKVVGEMATDGIVTTVTSMNSIVWQPSEVSVIISYVTIVLDPDVFDKTSLIFPVPLEGASEISGFANRVQVKVHPAVVLVGM